MSKFNDLDGLNRFFEGGQQDVTSFSDKRDLSTIAENWPVLGDWIARSGAVDATALTASERIVAVEQLPTGVIEESIKPRPLLNKTSFDSDAESELGSVFSRLANAETAR